MKIVYHHSVLYSHQPHTFCDGNQDYQHYSGLTDTSSMGNCCQKAWANQDRLVTESSNARSSKLRYQVTKILTRIQRRLLVMSLGSLANSDTFLAKSLESLHDAKDDAREYHKLETNVPKVLQFIIEDKERDVLVERKVKEDGEDKGKPFSETTFVRVINLGSQMQEPKPLRTSSVRLLKKLTDFFDQGEFTLEIMRYGEKYDTDYRVKVVKQ